MLRRLRLTTYSVLIMLMLAGAGSIGWAQQSSAIPDPEFGSIPDSILNMQVYEPDPSAPYVYAIKNLDVTFEDDERSIIALLDYHVRVKVFDASARQASLVAIPYYFDNGIEEVEYIRGVTHTLSGKQIPLNPQDVRTININSRYNVKEFTMPAVEDGVVMEYSYRIRRRYIEELPDFFLSHRVPTLMGRVSIAYPGYLRYDVTPSSFDGKLYHHEERRDTSSVAKVFTLPRPEPLLKETWAAYHIPAVEEEAYISSLDDYRARLKFQLSEFGVPRQKLVNSWEFVVAQFRRNQNVLELVRRNKQAQAIGRSIAQKRMGNPEAVQDSIFRYLNAQANFNGTRSTYSSLSDEHVLSGQPSDQAAINQTLLAMLKGAGIEAWPVIISTREYGQIDKSFPSLFQFNGQLVWSQIGDEIYFMDASFEHSQPNLIPVETYNETGLLLKPDSFEWKEISPSRSVFAIDIRVDASLDRQGNLSGTVETASSGYPGQVIRQQAAGGASPQEILAKAIFDGYANAGFSDVAISGLSDYGSPVGIDAGFTLEKYATSFSDGLQFRPMVVGYLMSNPFNEGDRDLPVTLDAPEKLDLKYTIRIPNGFTVEGGTQNRTTELRGARLTESYRVEGQVIRYEFHIDITRKRFGPELYPQLLDLYKRWVELSNTSWLIRRN